MIGHKPGVLDKCPICREKFKNTDKDVKLYQLQFMRWPLPRNMKAQTIWYRIHEHCIEDYPADCEQQLAGLYVNPGGIAIIDDSHTCQYE
ncbi:hypothetical protein BW14_07060 [Bifidobacterium sp. UTBIF-68]|uniref:hypothetical protein n=1 Tax=Bifidobacterium sp. UTBIF-68 TaxID=1465262 RepID=UPI0011296A06|nr:hypothetical protein [Bifidobacterium sp. UTBIF-68]TPF92914.1 hypothetical protein BW14_07060 [Bifidobacterium sp. UTBIF-68]